MYTHSVRLGPEFEIVLYPIDLRIGQASVGKAEDAQELELASDVVILHGAQHSGENKVTIGEKFLFEGDRRKTSASLTSARLHERIVNHDSPCD